MPTRPNITAINATWYKKEKDAGINLESVLICFHDFLTASFPLWFHRFSVIMDLHYSLKPAKPDEKNKP